MPDTTDSYLVSDQTRREVWERCHGAEYAERYYQLLGNRYLKRHRWWQFATISLGGGAVVPAAVAVFSGTNGAWVGAALGLVGVMLAAVSVVSLVGDFARKASVATAVAQTCARAARDLRDLLSAIDLEQIDETAARAGLAKLATLLESETYSTVAVGIQVDNADADSEKAEREARAHLESMYAT